MKRIITLLLLCLMIVTLYSETIKIGFFQLEPYVIAGTGNADPTGFAAEFWQREIAPKMGVDLEWVGPLPIPRLLSSLENGDIDVVLAMASNPDRAKKFIIPEKPYMYMQASLTFRKDDPITEIPNLEALTGMKIGYVEGAFLPPYMRNDNITIDAVTQSDYKTANFQKLLRKRIDSILDMNSVSNLYEAKRLNMQDKIKLLPLPVEPTGIYSLFTRSDKGRRLASDFEKTLNGISSTTIINRLMSKYK